MGEQKGPDYYDVQLARVCEPLETSPWRRLYETVLSIMPPPAQAEPVADLGCGTGRFARLLQQNGYTDYWGVDFSTKRIEEARRYVPGFEFTVADLLSPEVHERLRRYQVFVLTEVLEHVTDDLDILSRLPSGGHVIVSVPNFDSAGHVRYFESVDKVIERFETLIDFAGQPRLTLPLPSRPEKKIFVVRGVRK
ncbi:MAG: class I SAM-dependent methyltransferase [Planctomycetes bacterium]|nr:class I SAM-dependent methyltransferase [Planctomycetota bacterium]